MPAFTHLEFHRTGIGLVPERPGETDTAIYVATVPGSGTMRSCTCKASKKKTCDHLKDLSKALAEVERAFAAKIFTREELLEMLREPGRTAGE